MNDKRYPYTHAADALREVAADGAILSVISRSQSSAIRKYIAEVIGMDDAELARRIADRWLKDLQEDAA